AAGAFLTDFALVPTVGIRITQYVAVFSNAVAGLGALVIADRGLRIADLLSIPDKRSAIPNKSAIRPSTSSGRPEPVEGRNPQSAIRMTSAALAMIGFSAMGMEILWFRHFTILLGQLRAVFSLLLTVILIGIGAGSLVSARLIHRTRQPAEWLMVVQGLFVALTLIGLAASDASSIEAVVMADPAYAAAAGRAIDATRSDASGWARTLTELWFNASPLG